MAQNSISITEYESYPPDIASHVASFEPFVSRRLSTMFALDYTELVTICDVVDISCVDKKHSDGEKFEFKGSASERELLYLELSKFIAAFLSRLGGQSHWLDSTDLTLYLSQLQLYSQENPLSVPERISKYAFFDVPVII